MDRKHGATILAGTLLALGMVSAVAAQDSPESSDPAAPRLRFFYVPQVVRLDAMLDRLKSAAARQSMAYAVYDFREDANFLELLRLEESHGLKRTSNAVLFAPDRALVGAEQILAYLSALAQGEEPPPVPVIGEVPTDSGEARSGKFESRGAMVAPSKSAPRAIRWSFLAVLFVLGLVAGIFLGRVVRGRNT